MYTLTDTTAITNHGVGLNWLVRDAEPADITHQMHTRAMVASGDFCETLAARLEQIALALPATSAEYYQLQNTITELLYVQRHYNIVKQ